MEALESRVKMDILDQVIQFHNCYIVRDGKVIRENLWTKNGKIINPEPLFFDEKKLADIRIDCGNILISPGFIDVQLNGYISLDWKKSSIITILSLFSTGGFGIDFSDPNENIGEGLKKVAKGILSHGTTSFCPTLVTSPPEFYHKVCSDLRTQEFRIILQFLFFKDFKGYPKNTRKCRGSRDFRCPRGRSVYQP